MSDRTRKKRVPLVESVDYTDFVVPSNHEHDAKTQPINLEESTVKKANKKSMPMWFREAADNPFDKKDDKGADKPEEKKDDKKAPPFPPKKDDGDKDEKKDDKGGDKDKGEKKKSPFPPKKKDGPSDGENKKDGPHDEADDIAKAKEALELVEELKKSEDLESEDHKSLDEAMRLLKEFIGEEKSEEHGKPPFPPKAPAGPAAPGMKPMKMDIVPPAAPKAPGKPGMPPAAPKPPMAPHASWVIENSTGYKIGDRVWPVSALGNLGGIGYDPGRVIAFADDGSVVVDWGDEMPTNSAPEEIVAVKDIDGQDALFSEAEFSPASNGIDVGSIPEELFAKNEAEAILAKLSLKDMMTPIQSEVGPDTIVHTASGKIGKFISTASDGRCLVSFDEKNVYVWPHEFKFAGKTELF